MNKQEMHYTLMAAKTRKGISWEALGEVVDRSPVWVASACYGMNSAPPAVAHAIAAALELGDEVVAALEAFPTKTWDQAIPQDPLIYRLYEIVGVYGPTLKDVIQEKFGDGIMSAIDFEMEVERHADPKGDRVVVTMSGKFLPYKSW
jgi:cyanate lyase